MFALNLPDGRRLDVEITGPDDGVPLLYHHGTPGSVVQEAGLATAAHERGMRLVSWSRPGYGSSARLAGRSVSDVATDALAVLDHLDAPHCLVAGKSGGGPHALATAALLPERVAGVASIAGVGPYGASDLDFLAGMGADNVEEFGLALRGESAVRPWLADERLEMLGADAAGLVATMDSLLPEVDRAALTGDYAAGMIASIAEGLRDGVDGWLDDDLAFARPWGFELATITVPVFVWQGGADLMVPFAHGQWLVANVPGATAHLLPEEGHLSIGVGAVGAILDELVATL